MGWPRVLAPRARGTLMKCQGVVTLGHFHQDRILSALRAIILSQFSTQAAGLDPYHRVHMRVEVLLAPEDFGRNLVLLWGATRMLQGMICEVTQQFAKGFGAMESKAAAAFFG